ncbi:hypothetical protein GC098_15250 [Paenibacillus sp. LMG 31458]|uniref:Uncharacterized protein n=1 Tax=Paenibacillus phytorum TaxID=2654977 RepID=A0ABX1XW76_9BACL|nr:hypothetical protein [Paenibacillus phytorum]NOU72761.1 hypothetical protein [Paenibacillus phytorum]
MKNYMVKFLFKSALVFGTLVFIVYLLLFLFIYSRTPEQAIQKKIGNLETTYIVNNADFIDKDGSNRYYISELDGKFTDSIPHIFYLKKTSAGWIIVNYGNAP